MFYKHQEVPHGNVAALRKAAHMTQADLADAVNVTRQTIIAIEKGNYTPSVLLALKLSKVLNKKVRGAFLVMNDLFSKGNRSDIIVAIILLVCLLLSSNALSSFMPSSIVMLAIALFVAAFCLFAVLIWRERPRDEREAHLMLSSDRLGFLAGAIVLSVALVVASLRHESTNLLALSLTVMILGKILGKYVKM